MIKALNREEKKKFTEEQQNIHEVISTLTLFIIQAIVIPILYINTTIFKDINMTNTLCIVGLIYFILKQMYFSGSDGSGSGLGICGLSFLWMVILFIFGPLIVNNTEISNQTQLQQGIDLAIKCMGVNLGIILTVFLITLIQEYIQDTTLEQNTTRYRQNINQIERITLCFVGIGIIIAGVIAAISLLTTKTMNEINWEKFIVNSGIIYITTILGTLLRR